VSSIGSSPPLAPFAPVWVDQPPGDAVGGRVLSKGLPPNIEDPTALDRIMPVFRLVKDSKVGRDVV
jgi:hypothetical protein